MNKLENLTLTFKPLDFSLSFLILGVILKNYDFISLGLATYQAAYIEPIKPKNGKYIN
jgi:hypothetical protein